MELLIGFYFIFVLELKQIPSVYMASYLPLSYVPNLTISQENVSSLKA